MNIHQFKVDYSRGKKVSKRDLKSSLDTYKYDAHNMRNVLEDTLNICDDPQPRLSHIACLYFSNFSHVQCPIAETPKITRSTLLTRDTKNLLHIDDSMLESLNKYSMLRENVMNTMRTLGIPFSHNNGNIFNVGGLINISLALTFERTDDMPQYKLTLCTSTKADIYQSYDFLHQSKLDHVERLDSTHAYVDLENMCAVKAFFVQLKKYIRSYTFRDYVQRTLKCGLLDICFKYPSINDIELDPGYFTDFCRIASENRFQYACACKYKIELIEKYARSLLS